MSSVSKIFSSSILLLATRLVHRSIGLISTIILARVLTPKDFGVVAGAAIIVQLFNILSLSGGDQYIIKKENVDNDDLNTAWTIDLTLKFILWLSLNSSTTLIDGMVPDAKISNALHVLSFILLFQGLQNPGLFLLKKRMEYKSIFILNITFKILSFFSVLFVALTYRSYWAIIIGDLVSSFTVMIGSYVIHSFRPRICFKKIKEQFAFSQWILLKGILGYTRSQIDNMLISRFFGSIALGQYSLVKSFAMLVADEIISPITEPLLATFSDLSSGPKYFAKQIRLALLVVCSITLPICFFGYMYSQQIILLLLGDQWDFSSEIFANLMPMLFASSIGLVVSHACVARNKVRFLFFYDFFSLLFVSISLAFLLNIKIELFALSRSILGLISAVSFMVISNLLIKFNLTRLTILLIPILIQVFIISFVVFLITLDLNIYIELLVYILIYFTLYFISIIILVYYLKKYFDEYEYLYCLLLKIKDKLMIFLKKNIDKF